MRVNNTKTHSMDAQQIREAIDQDKQVFWGTPGLPGHQCA